MCSDSDADALLDATKVMKGFEFHAEERTSEKPSDAKSLERRKREKDYRRHECVSRTNSPTSEGKRAGLTRCTLYTREAVRRRGKVDRRKRDFTGIQFPETAHHTDWGG